MTQFLPPLIRRISWGILAIYRINEISNSTINSLISSYINIEKFDVIDLSISLKLGLGDVGYIGNLTATNMKRLTDAFKETDLYKKVVQNKEEVCKRWQN